MPSRIYERVYGSYLADMVVNNYYRVDFVFLNNCKYEQGVGSIINVPGEAVDNLYIRNDGPCLIQYSVNGSNLHEMIGGVIAKTMTREFHWDKANIKSVNLFILSTGSSTGASVSVDVSK